MGCNADEGGGLPRVELELLWLAPAPGACDACPAISAAVIPDEHLLVDTEHAYVRYLRLRTDESANNMLPEASTLSDTHCIPRLWRLRIGPHAVGCL